MALQVRCPSWAAGDVAVRVNGKTAATGKPGTFAAVRRTWKDGDTVEVTIPMALRTEPMPDNAEKVALLYGPIVLAGNLGPEDKEVARVPVFVTGGEPLTKHVEPVAGQALGFRTGEVGRPEDVTFAPFYRTIHARYSVYWEEFTESQWKDREAAYRAEEARRRELEARTLDYLAVGEMQPERDHAVTGEKTGAGEAMGRKWRHATDGGWFSFEMKVSPDAPADLVLTYWGSDANGRDFDILVDGTKIASQVLENNRPGQFYDETYPIPRELTSGKEKVTVRLQAHPGRWAGGLFGARTVRRTSPEATSP
jgi:hypothetical protein